MLGGIFSAVMHTAWKPVRGMYEGATGGTKVMNRAGEKVKINPLSAQARRIKQNTQTLLTGNKYDYRTGNRIENAIRDRDGNITDYRQSWLGQHVGNRIGAAAHIVGDLTLGMTASAIGWGMRPVAYAGALATRPLTRALGHATWQTGSMVAGTTVDAAKTIHAMNQTRVGRGMLFGGAVAAFGVAGGASSMMKDRVSDSLAFYSGRQVDSLPGTIAEAGAAQGSRFGVDSLGADGELALSLHNLR